MQAVQERGDRVTGKIQESPNARKALGILTLLAGAVAVLTIGGFMLGGIALALVVGVPLFILFSPILVPLGFVLFLVVSGLLLAGGSFVAFLSFVSWVYNYAKGHHPVGSDKIDAARHKIMGTIHHGAERGREYGSYATHKTQEVAPGA